MGRKAGERGGRLRSPPHLLAEDLLALSERGGGMRAKRAVSAPCAIVTSAHAVDRTASREEKHWVKKGGGCRL